MTLNEARSGETQPARRDVRGFVKRPLWLMDGLRVDDARRLFLDLAEAENQHDGGVADLDKTERPDDAGAVEADARRRLLVLQIVQPALAGLIDGSISTLAPIFAAAFATRQSSAVFMVGLASSLGAGVSMGLTEALSDDGAVTGRGRPWVRGAACGAATAVGGLGHTLPYLIRDFWLATAAAGAVVAFELAAIAWIRWRFMRTPIASALIQVVLGGLLALAIGIAIGGS